jgi:DNA mismatch repair ATPase MutS
MGVSNFLRDLFETSFAVAGATDRSLVLIDEFGIGTNEVEYFYRKYFFRNRIFIE